MKIVSVIPVDFRQTGTLYDVVCVFQNDSGEEFKEWIPFQDKNAFLQRVQGRVLELQQEDINAVDIKTLLNQPIELPNLQK